MHSISLTFAEAVAGGGAAGFTCVQSQEHLH
jgi:hypothetical protein